MQPKSQNRTAAPAAAAPKAPRETLEGIVEDANPTGVMVDGRWYNYARIFSKGPRVSKEVVGHTIELTLVSAHDGKLVCGWKLISEPEPIPEPEVEEPAEAPEAPDGARKASPQQLAYAEDLALGEKVGLSQDELEELVRIRFKKPIGELAPTEASLLITFLGGYTRSGGPRFGT